MVAVSLARLSIFAGVVLIGLPIWTFLRNLTRASLLVMAGSSPIRELTSLLFKTGLFMCSACCGNLLILLLDGLACCLACCFVLSAFRRPLVSFAHFTRYLGCDGFIRAFGGSAAWSVVSSGLAPGGGWFRLFFPLLGLGWLWFPRLLLGCGLLAAVCCGGSFLLPSAHALSTWGQFMDKVMNNCCLLDLHWRLQFACGTRWPSCWCSLDMCLARLFSAWDI